MGLVLGHAPNTAAGPVGEAGLHGLVPLSHVRLRLLGDQIRTDGVEG